MSEKQTWPCCGHCTDGHMEPHSTPCGTCPAASLPAAVPCVADATVTASGNLRHLCPHVDEVDNGRIEITWRVNGQTFELHSLAEYLRGFKDALISHEEITDRIRHDLASVDGIELLSVATTWDTAGMEVRCSTSPTPAVTP